MCRDVLRHICLLQGILCLGSTTLPSLWLKGGTSWALLLLSWLNPLGICPEAALAREGDHVWVCPRDLSRGRAVLAPLHTPQACIILTVL